MTALGLSPKDKNNVRTWMKQAHNIDQEKKRAAEHKIRAVFDEKVHLLAINLGEEIDKLAEEDRPGYFFWGDEFHADRDRETVRTTRNILKLIESGKGAGGATRSRTSLWFPVQRRY